MTESPQEFARHYVLAFAAISDWTSDMGKDELKARSMRAINTATRFRELDRESSQAVANILMSTVVTLLSNQAMPSGRTRVEVWQETVTGMDMDIALLDPEGQIRRARGESDPQP